jgi:hypothetical protein
MPRVQLFAGSLAQALPERVLTQRRHTWLVPSIGVCE